jgi:hypothetical protein
MDATEQVWRTNFAAASVAIPADWLVHADDGFGGVHPDHRNHPSVVRLPLAGLRELRPGLDALREYPVTRGWDG